MCYIFSELWSNTALFLSELAALFSSSTSFVWNSLVKLKEKTFTFITKASNVVLNNSLSLYKSMKGLVFTIFKPKKGDLPKAGDDSPSTSPTGAGPIESTTESTSQAVERWNQPLIICLTHLLKCLTRQMRFRKSLW